MLGGLTNSNGTVSYLNATVRDDAGILLNQVIATYVSDMTDSGAPVIHYHQNGTANLFGIHVGKVCTMSFNGTIPDTVNDENDCKHLPLQLRVFSPWENVESFLNLK